MAVRRGPRTRAGVAGGRVTAERPDFRAQSLECHMQAVRGPARVILDLPLERVHMALAVRLEGGKIAERRDLRPYIGTLRRRWHAERKYHAYYPTTFSKPIPQYRSDASGPQLPAGMGRAGGGVAGAGVCPAVLRAVFPV